MSEMKHTPGPWHIEEFPYRHIRSEHGCVWASDYKPDANAHLIAVAPELLEVAMRLVAGYDALDYDIQSEARQAREIIAKATGGAQ